MSESLLKESLTSKISDQSKVQNAIRAIVFMFLAVILAAPMGTAFAAFSQPGDYLTPEEVTAPVQVTDPSGRVTFRMAFSDDSGPCQPRLSNFPITNTGPQDGVICNGQSLMVNLSYNTKPSATPTKVFARFPFEVKDLNGNDLLVNKDFNMVPVHFCQGGTGYTHTGVSESSRRFEGCEMTFPASNSPSSINAGGQFRARVTGWEFADVLISGKVALSNTLSGEKAESPMLPNPIRVVAVTTLDPAISRSEQGTYVVDPDGSSWYEFNYNLHYLYDFGSGTIFPMTIPGSNHTTSFDVRTTVDIPDLPEGSVIVSKSDTMTVDGTTLTHVDPKRIEVMDHRGYGDSAPKTTGERFTVRVPAEILKPQELYEWSPRVTSFEGMKNRSSLLRDDAPVTYPHAYLDGRPQPGEGKPSSYRTGLEILSVDGKAGYNNNDWALTAFTAPKVGNWYKGLWTDVDGAPSDVNMKISNPTGSPSYVGWVGDDFWAEFGIKPFAGSLNDAMYCDTWDPKLQKIDTDRSVIAESRSGENFEKADVTVQYGVTSRSPLPLTPNSTTETALSQEDCSIEGPIEWSDTPSDDTNMVRIIFNGDMNGSVAGSASVQRVYVPFTTTGRENFAPEYPNQKRVADSLVFQNSGTWDSKRELAFTYFRGEQLDLLANSRESDKQNSGTTQNVLLGWVGSMGQSPEQNNIELEVKAKYTISSGFSNIEIRENSLRDGFYIESFKRADFGPDGMPGTDDDVSDWEIIVARDKGSEVSSSGRTVIMDANGFVRGTIPGYITDGTKLPISVEIIPDKKSIELGDNPDNNKSYGNYIAVAKEAVSQTKWALSPYELVGNDIGWGVNWNNSSAEPSGRGVFTDVLPYNGDKRGTNLEKPLSNVRINPKFVDDDVTIEVTDHNPAEITEASIADGTVSFVPLEDQDSLSGEITAFRVIEESIEPNEKRMVEVIASTEGTVDQNKAVNLMMNGKVEGLALNIPETSPVTTVLLDTEISGFAWYDNNRNGSPEGGEGKRFSEVSVSLLNSDGETIETTTTDENGAYSFKSINFGDYTIQITDRGGNVLETYEVTTSEKHSAVLTGSSPKISNLNFGFWMDTNPGISVVKSIEGFEEGSSIPSGTEVKFNFVVSNTGDITIENIALSDDVLGDIVCPDTELAPGEEMTCSVTSEMKPTKIDDQIARSEGGKSPNGGYYHPGASLSGYNSESRNYYTGRQLCQTDFCPAGQRIVDLGFTADGKLIGGHGDQKALSKRRQL